MCECIPKSAMPSGPVIFTVMEPRDGMHRPCFLWLLHKTPAFSFPFRHSSAVSPNQENSYSLPFLLPSWSSTLVVIIM